MHHKLPPREASVAGRSTICSRHKHSTTHDNNRLHEGQACTEEGHLLAHKMLHQEVCRRRLEAINVVGRHFHIQNKDNNDAEAKSTIRFDVVMLELTGGAKTPDRLLQLGRRIINRDVFR